MPKGRVFSFPFFAFFEDSDMAAATHHTPLMHDTTASEVPLAPPPLPPSGHVLKCLISTLFAALQGYAPRVVVSKALVPWFDERVQDGNLGRQLHIEHMQSAGLGFVVHPNAFLVKQAVLGQLLQLPSEATQQADVSLISLF